MRRFIANNESRVHTLNYHNHRNPFLIMELKALKIQHLTISDTYVTYFFIKILLIVWACETGKAQAQQISISIHDVFNVTTDKKIKDELQIFSLQVLHCDNIFSAKCFTIDAKLLTAVVGSVSMYLIILFQFKNISNSCMEKTANTCFKDINNSLQQMQELIVNSGLCVPMFYYKLRNPFLIMKLKILEKQHMMISNTVQMLNTIFSAQLLTSMIITFCEISLNLYIYLVKWHNGLVINLNGQIDELILLAMIYYILKLALIVWACETCKNQAQEIRTTIHDVLNSTKDKHIKDELQSFSMQMLHCKNIFSTKSLNIDATFLATMMGTITTYTLIFLQFLIISHSCDENSTINIT
ncbi:PREDICTED: uncharacterized protein LOC108693539 [Atta colombica]|uniref:uncharacterized protein LOC108693539 n=1 Tax=Atta colombica TaxID=520822 RepID=UPI00084CC014|nr:PREDICTED: uncharacterized protein LOC108693539 [Atta colombica]